MNKFDVIIRPVMSEKTFKGVDSKKYAFEVAINATKSQIKTAVEQIFSVKVVKVNTARFDGKPKRQGRHEGKTSAWKKAYVQLSQDSKPIEFFESLK